LGDRRACLPNALPVLAGMFAIERFFCAPAWAFSTLRFAALTCFFVATLHLPQRPTACSSSALVRPWS